MSKMTNLLLPAAVAALAASAAGGIGDVQAMIDAQARKGGGRVVVPAGEWTTGPLRLSSGIELHLEDGARLVFPDDPDLYPQTDISYEGEVRRLHQPLVSAVGATNVAVTGRGTFMAKVGYWHAPGFKKRGRPKFFHFANCRDVRLEGFRIRNSPNWTIHMLCTDDVVMRGLDVRCSGPNTDGVDLESVQGALIENCRLDQGDDGFCMKSGRNAEGRRRARPTKDVTIRNCTVVNGHTLLGIGSELSGGVENIRLEDCEVEGEVWRVLFIKTNPARGGYVRNVSVRNVKAVRAKCSIFEIMPDYQWLSRDKPKGLEVVRTPIENVTVENVVCDEGWYAYELRGDPEMPPRGIAIRNCEMRHPSRGEPVAANIDGLTVEGVRAEPGPFSVWCDDADSLYECGQMAVFHVRSSITSGVAHVRLDNFGSKILKEFDVDLSRQREFTVEGTRDIPGFLLLTVKCGKIEKRWGAAFSPDRITAGAERPEDFEPFWRGAIARYGREVPEDVRLERLDALSTNGCDVYMLSLTGPSGARLYGFLKEPADLSRGPFPARVHIPGAGPSVGGPYCGDETTVGLTMNVHRYRPVVGAAKRGREHTALQKEEDDRLQALYPARNPRYTVSGIAKSREEYFYYDAILAANRAVDWLRRRPEVNAADVTYLGGSQGGGMGLAVVALNGGFRNASIYVPALTAHLCHLIDGREAGWPRLVEAQLPENEEAARRNAPYFDGVNFASLITCPIAFKVGYTDTVAPPHAGYAAYNACPARFKAIVGSVGFGHSTSSADSVRLRSWMLGVDDEQACDRSGWAFVDDESPGVEFADGWKIVRGENAEDTAHVPAACLGAAIRGDGACKVGDAIYPLPVTAAGRYALMSRIPYQRTAEADSSTAIEIVSEGVVRSFGLNQTEGSGAWREVGEFDLAPGAVLKIAAARSRGTVVADGFALKSLFPAGAARKAPRPLDVQGMVDAAGEGGVVAVPPGEWEVKPFRLRSGMTLALSEGAVVYASTNLADYAGAEGQRVFIGAVDATNVAIRGGGVIDGRGFVFREKKMTDGASQPQRLPVMMRFVRCRGLTLEGFTYRQSGAWGCHLCNCDGVVMRRLTCYSHANHTNDGIDIESSNVLVEDCTIDADDDAIVFKTETDPSFAVTNALIRNCTLRSCCNAFKFGTGSYGAFRDVTLENCRFERPRGSYCFAWSRYQNEYWPAMPGVTNSLCGIAGVAIECVDGGSLENVTVRNVTIDGYMTPIFIRHARRHEPAAGRETCLRNVLIENVRAEVADSRIACSVTGVPGCRVNGVTLRNVSLKFPGGGTQADAERPVPEKEKSYPEAFMFDFQPLPAWAFYVRHADGVRFENVKCGLLGSDARRKIVSEDAEVYVDGGRIQDAL